MSEATGQGSAAMPTLPSPLHILLIDESVERASLLTDALQRTGFERITVVAQTNGLLEEVQRAQPDVILIDVESPSRDTLEQLTMIRNRQPTPVVMIAQDPAAQSIQAAVASGVCAYSVGGISASKVRPAIEIAMATFESIKALRSELTLARQQLGDQKRIDRAKCILIRQQNLSEDDAHRALRKLAMDRKRKLVDVADDLIAMSKLLGG